MKSRRGQILVLFCCAIVLLMTIVGVTVSCSGDTEDPNSELPQGAAIPGAASPDGEPRIVATQVWSAAFVLRIPMDPATQANQPADVALLDGRMFLADTANNRILEVSANGQEITPLDADVDPQMVLFAPMAIESYNGKLYVTDSGENADPEAETVGREGRVLVVTPSGAVDQIVELAKGSPSDTLQIRPIGLAVWPDGSFAVSDANNDRVNKYGADGTLIWTLGTGSASSDDTGFDVPGGLTLDKDGNLYVVDILNSKVKKFSPDGTFLFSFGEAGDTAGTFPRAKAVAVDDRGYIYVSDGLQVAIQVFDQEGTYVGFIGRENPDDPESLSLFQVPYGLQIAGDQLYVVDRFKGLFIFDLAVSESPSE